MLSVIRALYFHTIVFRLKRSLQNKIILVVAVFFLIVWVISIDVLNDYIIPGLRAVKQDIEALAPDCEVLKTFLFFLRDQLLFVSKFLSLIFGRKPFICFLKNVKWKRIRSHFHSKYLQTRSKVLGHFALLPTYSLSASFPSPPPITMLMLIHP